MRKVHAAAGTSHFYQLYLQQTIPEPISEMSFREVMFNCKSFVEIILFFPGVRASAPALKSLIQKLVEGQIDAKTFFSMVLFPHLEPQIISYFVKYFPIVQTNYKYLVKNE